VAVAGALVGVRGEIANVNVALALVLVVFTAAATGGRGAGAMSGMAAATSFDFFHTRPYGSLKIAGANDIATTLLLLVVGLAAGQAAEQVIRSKVRMQDDRTQLRRLRRVTSLAVSGTEDDRDLVMAVTAELVDTLGLDGCSFERPPFLRELPHLEPDGAIAGPDGRRAHGDLALPRSGVDLRVTSRRGTIGRFVLVPASGGGPRASSERRLVAVALAQELGLALAGEAS
jgi:hypothetical protein